MLRKLFWRKAVGKREIPHPEISPGIIAKFQLCSVLVAESYSSSCPLGFWTGEETSGPRKSLHEVVFHLVGGDHGLSARCVCRGQRVFLFHCEPHIQTFILSVTAEEIKGKENLRLWCFHLCFTQHRLWENCYELHLWKLADSWYVLALAPQFLICAVDHSLGLNVKNNLGSFENPNTWPLPGTLFTGISVSRGPGIPFFFLSGFLRCCQLYSSVNRCLARFHSWVSAERWESGSCTVSWGET